MIYETVGPTSMCSRCHGLDDDYGGISRGCGETTTVVYTLCTACAQCVHCVCQGPTSCYELSVQSLCTLCARSVQSLRMLSPTVSSTGGWLGRGSTGSCRCW